MLAAVSAPRSIRPLSPVLLSALILAAAPLGACKDEASNLSQMDQSEVGQSEVGQSEVGQSEVTPATKAPGEQDWPKVDEPDSPITTGGSEAGIPGAPPEPSLEGAAQLISPGASDRRVELRLGQADDAHYRITSLGMVHLPLFERPAGFAREEELRLSKCEGEGSQRSCLLSHSYRNYEAEPPTGAGMEREERQVSELATSHRIDASGLRTTATAVSGPDEAAGAEPGKALAEVHRMFCVRLPAEAVGEGATWKDVCRMRQAGTVVTRELTWQLAKLEDSPEGTRAELQYAGRVSKSDGKESWVHGQVKGALYFWVDAGEPHLMRERMKFVLDSGKGLTSGLDMRVQFTKVGADGETLVRTDGKAFEQSPTVINDPRKVPNGGTREAEHPGVK